MISLQVEIEQSPFVSLALQHNAVPIVHRLLLRLDEGVEVRCARVRLQLGDGLSLPLELQRAHWTQEWEITEPPLMLRAQELVATLETTRSYLELEVFQDQERIHQQHWPMEVQAYNHWAGFRGLPDLLCSFVLPHHPAVAELVAAARQRCNTLDGYQSGHVLEQARAIYGAIQDLGITYLQGASDWAEAGQKVRTPDQLLEHRQGNCLDVTLFMAAALRLVGLHPLLVLVEGHAFPGVWLRPEDDPDGPLSDVSSLQKCLALGLICLFDSSSACAGLPFEKAETVAREHLEKFQLALDLRASERQGIRPLPLRLTSAGEVVLLPEGERERPEVVRREQVEPVKGARAERELWEKRLHAWKNRLLDLSTRNRLLDVRKESNRRLLPLLLQKPQELLEELLGGATFLLAGRPRVLSEHDPRSPELANLQAGEDVVAREVEDNFRQRRLQLDLDDAESLRRSIELYRSDRLTLEETGSSTLFLALGSLIWTETEKAAVKRRSPVLLLPVELVRVRVQEPYKLRWRGEDVRINLTLLRKLQAEYQIDLSDLESWPGSEGETPQLPPLFQRLRSEILNQVGWNLEEDAYLGSFSFAKLLMLQDLERFPNLEEAAPRLRGFLQGEMALETTLVTPHQVDSQASAEDSRCVLDADSSQLAAVYSSQKGASFVLQGPPGTGKSQTITNMIAQNLAQGRSVLFVAEKLAALEVVYRRLQRSGLGPYCLQLHSNKASKAEILNQLKESLEATANPSGVPESLKGVQADLQAHVEELHRPRPLGMTVFQAVNRCSQLPPPQPMDLTVPPDFDQLESFRNLSAELQLRAGECGEVATHPWKDCRLSHWDGELRQKLSDCLARGRELLPRYLEVAGQGGLERAPSPAEVEPIHQLLERVLHSPQPLDAMLEQNPWNEVRAPLELAVQRLEERQQKWSQLEPHFQESLLTLDLEGLQRAIQKWHTVLLLGWVMLWGSRRKLRRVARGPLMQSQRLLEQLGLAQEVRALDRQLATQDRVGETLLGSRWQGPHSDPQVIRALLDWCQDFRQRWRDWRDTGALPALTSMLREAANGEVRPWLGHFGEVLRELRDWVGEVSQLLRLQPTGWSWEQWREWLADRPLDRLPAWTLYQEVAQKLPLQGLEPAILAGAGESTVLHHWLQGVVPHRFLGSLQQQRVEQFRRLDPQWIRHAQGQLGVYLRERVPPVQEQGAKGEMGVLLREMKKQRNIKAPRQLFKEVGNLLQRLKPCLLMSPLSIAQYLDPSNPPFDLVVFDEASQIAPWDALGALARGRQWVVVGDSRQLPPTSFFAIQSEEDEEEVELGGTLESILDECQAAGMPQMRLNWHYRSADERLIAFSNHRYYEDGLFTFPTAQSQHPERGVHWVHVGEGRFGRSGSRTNRAEAEALVAHLLQQLRTSGGNRSFGVVTFNQSQQVLIENLLDEARTRDPELERHFSGGVEPVFIKNLENVQGDERDVIYFSVAYAPDAQGKFRMEFGPLNRQGGERRLNVAVSRARQQMWVFSSIVPEQIDLNRANARGARDLRAFLDYARRGGQLVRESEAAPEALSVALSQRLQSLGWQCQTNLGSSQYRLDLGVLHPHRQGAYLAAIEWDGPNYASAPSTRDRDRLRHSVLSGLGWSLIRVWAIEWWRDPERVVREVNQRLQQLLQEGPAAEQPLPEPLQPESPPVVVVAPVRSELVAYREVELAGKALEREPHQLSMVHFLEILEPLVAAEAPLTVGYLFTRLARALGSRKVGTRMRAHFESLLQLQKRWLVEDDTVWHSAEQKAGFQSFRVGPRELVDVPLVEVENAIAHELALSISLSENELVRAVARHFGKEKAGRDRILAVLCLMESAGRCRRHLDNWVAC